jgi:hypothetical protein
MNQKIASVIAFAALMSVIVAYDFYVWRLKHRTAPTWTYITE